MRIIVKYGDGDIFEGDSFVSDGETIGIESDEPSR